MEVFHSKNPQKNSTTYFFFFFYGKIKYYKKIINTRKIKIISVHGTRK